jgi:hypothetical protein
MGVCRQTIPDPEDGLFYIIFALYFKYLESSREDRMEIVDYSIHP